jgi:cytochrome c-type biogenesis protein CcmH
MPGFFEKAGAPRLFIVALPLALVVSLIALAVYVGADGAHPPGVEDSGRPHIPGTTNSRAEADALVRRLRGHLQQQPRDARGWTILARLQFDAEQFAEAAQAYEKALALPSKVVRDPAVWCEYADALGMTQNGSLAGRPRELIDRALVLNPYHPKALEMAGSAEYGQGDYAAALRYWRPLLAVLDIESQAHKELGAAIDRTERLAKITTPRQEGSK